MKKYVAYYRVSTKSQGNSGLGLKDQRESVLRYVGQDKIVQEFTEIESGRNTYRKELREAIELCQETGATLVIARLDRLSRNAAFTMALRDSDIDFVAVDMPDANSLTIGIMSVIAQNEAETTSKNTKKALAVLKREGKKLGTPENLTEAGRTKSIQVRKQRAQENKNNRTALTLIDAYEGMTLEFIAKKLNDGGFKTRNNCNFTPTQVTRLKKLYA